jgi:hypothetical protein|tara:strand:- start:1077 stop:1238 length:162 start_codon:yes stop_codon:yes gene_type:complete
MKKYEMLYRFGSEPWFAKKIIDAVDLKDAINKFYTDAKHWTLVNVYELPQKDA